MNKPYLKSTIFLFLFLFNRTFGQNIPDANFAAAIRVACPTCIDASNNLTASATTITTLNVNYNVSSGIGKISSLAGIEGFTNLNIFNCEYNSLTSVPTLPSTLTQLFCEGNQISSLPDPLPSNMTILALKNNMLSTLPSLPNTLTKLNITLNKVTSLPALPPNLESLSAYSNLLTTIPTLPNSLRILGVSYNNLSSLPMLNAGLTYLDCSINHISIIPTLPSTLTYLDCSINSAITSLPNLPTGLTTLAISTTGTTCLPNLPSGIKSTLPICGTVLPLELLEFQAIINENAVEIKWATGSESNLSDFTLEKSTDNVKYYPLSIQAPRGSLTSKTYYDFIDNAPENVNYYRLKTNEKDGTFSYSKVISAVFKSNKKDIRVYPNPFKTGLRVDIEGDNFDDTTLIQLIDITGRIQISKVYYPNEILETSNLANGMYILKIIQTSNTIERKLIKE